MTRWNAGFTPTVLNTWATLLVDPPERTERAAQGLGLLEGRRAQLGGDPAYPQGRSRVPAHPAYPRRPRHRTAPRTR
ncbi:hypothetical protein GTV15_14285, partial [Streptomyces sp. SID7803]|nr:hypothetical protein [Streptomyces sp. SID7803]